jgi:RNA polymerase sigma-70 factor (ECF subfamily)
LGKSFEETLAAARAGDRSALEALLEQQAPAVYRFARSLCGCEDVEDIVQDALVIIASKLGDYQGRASFSSWVFAVTRSACARRRRGKANQPKAPLSEVEERAGDEPSPEQRVERRQIARLLDDALISLPEAYREAILLRDVEGLSAPDAAASLGIGVEALKSRLHRARAALRDLLAPTLGSLPRAPGCPDVVALWSRKLEGELTAEDCATMEKHLEGCPSCGAVCDVLRDALLACRRLGEAEVPRSVQARVRVALRALTQE